MQGVFFRDAQIIICEAKCLRGVASTYDADTRHRGPAVADATKDSGTPDATSGNMVAMLSNFSLSFFRY